MHQVGRLNYIISVSLIIASIFTIANGYVLGREVNNTSTDCADLILIFARGSSDNKNHEYLNQPFLNDFISKENMSGAFFQWMEKRLKADYPHIDYKAISIHNSGQMWSANGYPAVGIFNASTINNMFDAEWSWWPAGEYRGSVRSGMDELKGQINHEVTRCPNQRVVVGGYSQGAHVVGDALFEVPQNQRNTIDNVVLFGDPKFIGAEYNKYNLFDKPKAYPWHRGTAGLRERGANDARIPYVPDDMKYKTISWCHEDDFVCTGFSGLGWGITNHELPSNDNSLWSSPKSALGDGHSRYPLFGVPEATEEVIRNLRSQLQPLEIARGGLDPKKDPTKTLYDGTIKTDRAIDLSFVINTSGNMDDGWSQFFGYGASIMNQLDDQFTNVQYALGGFGESSSTGIITEKIPRMRGFHNLTPHFSSLLGQPYISYGIGGGGDFPEPHGLAIENYAMRTNWRIGATKHIVLITERPPHQEVTFNECGTRILFQYENTEYCKVGTSTYSTKKSPERCTTIFEVASSDTCTVTYSTTTHTIKRTLNDAIALARAKGFVVDVIQPHTMRDADQNCNFACSEKQLKDFAEATGGLYLKYSLFDQVALRDALWQILNHRPQLMLMSPYEPGNLLNFATPLLPEPLALGVRVVPTQTPILVSTTPVVGALSYSFISGSNTVVSDGPTAEIIVDETGFLTVYAHSGPNGTGDILSSSVTPVTTGEPKAIYQPIIASNVTGIIASLQQDGNTVVITWNVEGSSDKDLVVIRDPISGVIIGSAPVDSGGITLIIGAEFGGEALIQTIRGGGESEGVIVPIVPYVTSSENNYTDSENEENNGEETTDNGESSASSGSNTDASGDVGLTDDKIVTQNEGRSNSVLASTPVLGSVIPASLINTVATSGSRNDPSQPSTTAQTQNITTVAGVETVNTNPQSNVGDESAVRTLFGGDNTEKRAEETVNSGWGIRLLWIAIIGVPLFLILLVLLFFIRRKDDEEESPTT